MNQGVLRRGAGAIYYLNRDWHYDDLAFVDGYRELLAAAEEIENRRCGSGQTVLESLVTTWLSPRPGTTSVRSLVNRWVRALEADAWWEYHAVGFASLELTRSVALGRTVRMLRGYELQVPEPETVRDRNDWLLFTTGRSLGQCCANGSEVNTRMRVSAHTHFRRHSRMHCRS